MALTCQPWCDPADLHSCSVSDPVLLAEACQIASDLLFSASARQWPGRCAAVVRPCGLDCGCWQVLPSGYLVAPGWPYAGPWLWTGREWSSPYGTCGCGWGEVVQLDGAPITAISSVTIGADTLDPSSYRLDGDLLVRCDGGAWPSCQDLCAEPGEAGSFVVSYEWGALPPSGGVAAARELACEVALSLSGDPTCQLPRGLTRIVRQGVTLERSAGSIFGVGQRTGLVLTDLFLDSVNPNRLPSPTTVWTPDLPPAPRSA